MGLDLTTLRPRVLYCTARASQVPHTYLSWKQEVHCPGLLRHDGEFSPCFSSSCQLAQQESPLDYEHAGLPFHPAHTCQELCQEHHIEKLISSSQHPEEIRKCYSAYFRDKETEVQDDELLVLELTVVMPRFIFK